MMLYPLAIGGVCIVASIDRRPSSCASAASQSIMGALYKGFIASR